MRFFLYKTVGCKGCEQLVYLEIVYSKASVWRVFIWEEKGVVFRFEDCSG